MERTRVISWACSKAFSRIANHKSRVQNWLSKMQIDSWMSSIKRLISTFWNNTFNSFTGLPRNKSSSRSLNCVLHANKSFWLEWFWKMSNLDSLKILFWNYIIHKEIKFFNSITIWQRSPSFCWTQIIAWSKKHFHSFIDSYPKIQTG